ncbi:hypothetical protein ACWEG1_05845 [Streptomyces bauhiniae]
MTHARLGGVDATAEPAARTLRLETTVNHTDPTPDDFDGCGRKCRKAGAHTHVWGQCEHATPPEPTVSMSRVYTDTDGQRSIGFDVYTVEQLAELLDPVLGSAAMRARTGSVDLAHLAAHAIMHRNDADAAPVLVSPPPDRAALRDRIAEALWPLTDWDGDHLNAERAADAVLAVLPESGRAATLLEAANHLDRQALAASPAAADVIRADASELRRLAAEAPQPDTEALVQQVRRLTLMVDEYGAGASALTHKLKQVRDRHRETCILVQGHVRTPAFACGMCDLLDKPATACDNAEPAIKAHEPLLRWRVEILDGTRWKPESSPFMDQTNAVLRCAFRTERMPVWPDGTPVQRRIVPVATTYTVEQADTEATAEHHTVDGTRYLCHTGDHYCPAVSQPAADGDEETR